jgi:uncharacterized repeat protein (TIGR03943 family)
MTNAVRTYLPAATALLLAWFLATGRIYLLVHANSVWLVALAVPVLAAMTVFQLGGRLAAHADGLALGLLAIPVAVGIAVPVHALGAFAMDQQAATSASAVVWQADAGFSFASGDAVWDIHQLARVAASDPSLKDFAGQRASLLGFVYRRPSTPTDEFLISHFIVRCCTADATALSFPVHYASASELARDTWVQVDGQIHLNGPPNAPVPVVEADAVKVIPQPGQPYLYP